MNLPTIPPQLSPHRPPTRSGDFGAGSAPPKSHAEKLAWAFASFPRFCGLLKIPPKDGGERIPFVLSPIQRQYNAARTKRDIILKPRQVYMTSLEAARDLWWFLTKRGARVVIVVQSQTDQVPLKDITYKFRVYVDSLRRLGVVLNFGAESACELTLPSTDSTLRIIQAGASEAAAIKKGRGGTINRLHFSEAAFFERAEDTFNSLTESVPLEGSEVVIESTPNGAGGFYYEQWQAAVEGRSAYAPHFFEWWKHPEYSIPLDDSEGFEPNTALEKTLLKMGVPVACVNWYRAKVRDKGGNDRLVAQEYPSDPDTCFLLSGRGFFDGTRIAEQLLLATDPVEELDIQWPGAHGQAVGGKQIPALRIWHEAEWDREYAIAVDTSEGTGGDAGTGLVFERGTGRHMATLWGQFKPWELARAVAGLGNRYNEALIAVERNNHGHACLRALDAEQNYGRIFHDRDKKPGWLNVEIYRTNALDTLEQAHRAGSFKTPDRFVLGEMRTFIINKQGRAEASPGTHDDLVLTAAIGWDVCCRPTQRRGLALLDE